MCNDKEDRNESEMNDKMMRKKIPDHFLCSSSWFLRELLVKLASTWNPWKRLLLQMTKTSMEDEILETEVKTLLRDEHLMMIEAQVNSKKVRRGKEKGRR